MKTYLVSGTYRGARRSYKTQAVSPQAALRNLPVIIHREIFKGDPIGVISSSLRDKVVKEA